METQAPTSDIPVVLPELVPAEPTPVAQAALPGFDQPDSLLRNAHNLTEEEFERHLYITGQKSIRDVSRAALPNSLCMREHFLDQLNPKLGKEIINLLEKNPPLLQQFTTLEKERDFFESRLFQTVRELKEVTEDLPDPFRQKVNEFYESLLKGARRTDLQSKWSVARIAETFKASQEDTDPT